MEVLSISWAGVRTQNFGATVRYFVENMSLPLTLRDDEAEVAHFRCASGDLFEIFGPNNPNARQHACPVFAFQVVDIGVARREMERRGLNLSQTLTHGKMKPGAISAGRTVIFMKFSKKGPRKQTNEGDVAAGSTWRSRGRDRELGIPVAKITFPVVRVPASRAEPSQRNDREPLNFGPKRAGSLQTRLVGPSIPEPTGTAGSVYLQPLASATGASTMHVTPQLQIFCCSACTSARS